MSKVVTDKCVALVWVFNPYYTSENSDVCCIPVFPTPRQDCHFSVNIALPQVPDKYHVSFRIFPLGSYLSLPYYIFSRTIRVEVCLYIQLTKYMCSNTLQVNSNSTKYSELPKYWGKLKWKHNIKSYNYIYVGFTWLWMCFIYAVGVTFPLYHSYALHHND